MKAATSHPSCPSIYQHCPVCKSSAAWLPACEAETTCTQQRECNKQRRRCVCSCTHLRVSARYPRSLRPSFPCTGRPQWLMCPGPPGQRSRWHPPSPAAVPSVMVEIRQQVSCRGQCRRTQKWHHQHRRGGAVVEATWMLRWYTTASQCSW